MISLSVLFEKVWSKGEVQANRLIGKEKIPAAISREMVKKGVNLPGGKKSGAIISGAKTLASR